MLWKLVFVVVIVGIVYTQFVSDSSQDKIEEKAKEIIEDITQDNSTESNLDTNSSTNINQNKMALGKINMEVETDCVIDSQCQSLYQEGAFCEDGTCYIIS